jgi:hypothetical protein
MEVQVKELTANQLYKQYKDEGGTLNFSGWLNREKKKGIFPINANLNEEVYMALNGMNEEERSKTIMGFPKSTLIIVGVVIVGAIVVSQIIKKK